MVITSLIKTTTLLPACVNIKPLGVEEKLKRI